MPHTRHLEVAMHSKHAHKSRLGVMVPGLHVNKLAVTGRLAVLETQAPKEIEVVGCQFVRQRCGNPQDS